MDQTGSRVSSSGEAIRPTVVVVGGGYGGATVAKALDETSSVVLVEQKDAFMHNIAALRALVDPSWLPRIFMPYDGLLTHGRLVRDRAVLVEPDRVLTASGEQIAADFIVLATGSTYPFPAKIDTVDTWHAQERIRAVHRAVAKADRVLLLGAGPVGIELAGEIRHVWPDKSIVLLDAADQVLNGPYKPELRVELYRQLAKCNVEVLLDSALRRMPPTAPGELGTFTVSTEEGTDITADIWLKCFGAVPNSDYLGEELARVRRADGFLDVESTLQVAGQQSVFALGDVATADANMAAYARLQAGTVANNINALSRGASDLVEYRSMGVAIVVPIGPTGGAGQFPEQDDILGSEAVAELKGRDMMIDRFREQFGLAVAGTG